jgi:hypothetical protein
MINGINFMAGALAPMQSLKVVAQWFVARGSSLPCTSYAALRLFVVRGSSSSCMTYTANRPCGEGLIVVPNPVAILGKGFVVAFFGERLVVALLDGCVLLGVLPTLTLGDVHTIFGVLNILAFGKVNKCLWQCTCRLWHTRRTQPQHTCAAGCCMARYGHHHIS